MRAFLLFALAAFCSTSEAADTPRAVRNDSGAEAAFLMISIRVEDIRAESVRHDAFWV